MNTILVIEDDQALAHGLSETLRAERYHVIPAATGENGFSAAIGKDIDLIILDLILPDKNGVQVCGDLRRKGVNTPIIMLTSKSDEVDKVVGLEVGADDYVTKPFSTRELLARINALLRRRDNKVSDVTELHSGDLHIDFRKMEAIKRSKRLQLTAKEFDVLKYLVSHSGEVVSRDELLNHVWGYEHFPTTRTVDTCIVNLRKKVEDDCAHPRHILTVHGVGYKFADLVPEPRNLKL